MQSIEDRTQLRKFGLVLAFGLIFLFGLIIPLLKENTLPKWPYITAIILLIPSIFKPELLNALYGPWMKLGHCLGWLNTRIILGFIFYVLVTPMGLAMRLFGKDPMDRRYLLNATTYRKKSNQNPPQHMEKPF